MWRSRVLVLHWRCPRTRLSCQSSSWEAGKPFWLFTETVFRWGVLQQASQDATPTARTHTQCRPHAQVPGLVKDLGITREKKLASIVSFKGLALFALPLQYDFSVSCLFLVSSREMSDFHTGNCCWSHRPLDLEGTGEVCCALLEVTQQDGPVERPSGHLKNRRTLEREVRAGLCGSQVRGQRACVTRSFCAQTSRSTTDFTESS